jgi:hypothetical protein
VSKPCLVGSQERALEDVERNVWEECTVRGLGNHVAQWVLEEEGSQRDEQGGVIDGEGVDRSRLVL